MCSLWHCTVLHSRGQQVNSVAFLDPHQEHPRMLWFIKRQIARQFLPRSLTLCRTCFLFWGIWMVKDVNRAIFPFKACIWSVSKLPFELGSRVLAVSMKTELGRLPVNLPDLLLSYVSCLTYTKHCSTTLECYRSTGGLFRGRCPLEQNLMSDDACLNSFLVCFICFFFPKLLCFFLRVWFIQWLEKMWHKFFWVDKRKSRHRLWY